MSSMGLVHFCTTDAAKLTKYNTRRRLLLLSLQVSTLDSGEIDYDDLRGRLEANKARPAIINVNIGTTVKGAVDDLDRVLDILQETGYTEDR